MKLLVGAFVVASAIGYLAYVGAANSWQYYVSVDEAVADSVSLTGTRIRVSGNVSAGSLRISEHRREAEFELAGARYRLRASCRCAIPDNLAEGIDVVVEGRLQSDGIQGHKVVTRCASKYQPKDAVLVESDSPRPLALR